MILYVNYTINLFTLSESLRRHIRNEINNDSIEKYYTYLLTISEHKPCKFR